MEKEKRINISKTNYQAAVASIPSSAGTYVFYAGETCLYVGKSINLKSRVRQYFFKNTGNHDNHIREMVSGITAVTWKEWPGEFAALLHEDYLIKRLKPKYNQRQNEYNKYFYLIITDEPFPMIQPVKVSDLGAEQPSLGPFKNKFAAEELMDMLNKYFKIRDCREIIEGKKCLRYDLGTCMAPCLSGKISKSYYYMIELIVQLFNGNIRPPVSYLSNLLQEFSNQWKFEKASEAHQIIKKIKSVAGRQDFLNQFRSQMLYIAEPETSLNYVLFNGNFSIREQEKILTPEELRTIKRLPPEPVYMARGSRDDQGLLVYSWINRHKLSYTFLT